MKFSETHTNINLFDIHDDIVWGLSGEAGISFELFPAADLRMCSEIDHPFFVSSFSRSLSLLPVHGGITFETEIVKESKLSSTKSDSGRDESLIQTALDEKYKMIANSGRSTKYYAHVWTGGVNPLKQRLLPSFLNPKSKQKSARKQLEENEFNIKEISDTLTSSFNSLKVESKRLNKQQIINRYWDTLSPSKSQILSVPEMLEDYSLRSQLASSNAKEEMGYFYLDGYYHAAVSFHIYTGIDQLNLGSLDNLVEILPLGSRYIFSVLVPDQEEFLNQLKKERRKTISLVQDAETDSKNKDYESRERERDIDAIITRCRSEGERIYVVSASVILRSPHIEDLVEWEKQLLFAMKEIFGGAQGIVEDCMHQRVFLAGLPFNGHLSPRRSLMVGSTAAALVPLSRAWQGTKERGMILQSSSREPVRFDIFEDNTPRHGIVCGTTGSGKSFTANMLLLSFLNDPNTRALVIDVGGSYRRIADVLEGAYFDVKLDEQYAINPMLPKVSLIREDNTFDPETLGAQVSLIGKIVGVSSGPGRLVLEKAIERVFRSKEEPLLSDLLKTLRDGPWDETVKAQTQMIINELMPYCEGVYSLLLSRPSKIRPFEKQITVFDLAGLKDHKALQSIMVNVIAFSINRQLENKEVKKVVIVDEGWEFFDDDGSAELISRLYRQARKQNAAIISLSQSPVEFLNSKASTAMLSNKHWVMALKMSSNHELLSKFGFSDQAIERSKAMQMVPKTYSEVLIQFGNNPARIARIVPTSIEYWIATTNASECAREKSMREQKQLSRKEIILEMAKLEPVLDVW